MVNDINVLINEYNKRFSKRFDLYIKSYKELDYDKLINNVSYALECSNPSDVANKRKFDRRHGHQKRRTKTTLDNLRDRLNLISCELNELGGSNCSFEKLYNYISDKIYIGNNKIEGIGPLFLYDTSLRIGSYFDILPNKRVYIHSGAKEGLKNLFNVRLKNKDASIDINSFNNKQLKKLKAYHIENFLCIYKYGELKGDKLSMRCYCDIDSDLDGNENLLMR